MFKRNIVISVLVLSAAPGYPYQNDANLQYKRPSEPLPDDPERASKVIDAFKLSWEGYYKYAFPNDELHPVSNSSSNSRNAWGASAVDALSTALIMNDSVIANQILAYIPTIDFTKTETPVSLFETTIRYLGGMLSAYDLLTGPVAYIPAKKEYVTALITQSTSLGNALSYAFDTPSGVPYNTLFFANRTVEDSPNGLATVGTLILEWTRLADLTGIKTYAALANRAETYLLNPHPASSSPFPGLLGRNINVTTGEFLDAVGGWTGGSDSYYEYLLKMYIYDPDRFSLLRDRYILAADSTIAHLSSHPASRPELTFLAQYDGTHLTLKSEHLAGFAGGNFILAGQVLGRTDYVKYGLALVDAWHETYNRTLTGIGPEEFGWDANQVPEDQVDFFNRSGFYITNAQYNLRPEVIESYFYAFRATGDRKYQDWAWDAFVAINATTQVGSGYSSIRDVNAEKGGGYGDFQESFWFAEVCKYAYMIFGPQDSSEGGVNVGRGGRDTWVFNTEAHPVRVWG
ncbi:mannosyl-oligosaccharide 1,2-alpha-mannosidase precursor [Westerdykella ornata]|uniref:alpha-1,2-Mannosidase n=1 Tax=Westerdykella ornata TaxID=318751 RepID=A0A6A6JH87_WESOR|nr:mannosyl-oligosaccharide 1,2-alpha-mannosidase precursor [Westerdykella ornata]KAF2275473.1 mannosyl-oligosaccharide 1,2-alpha-mannosidase precursor [Westerdykella ornata]